MALNINNEVEDTFYRYKMPKLQAKVEGKGNGIKTVIVNVTEIARALHRKPIYVTKFFGCELGAQINVDDKNDRYIVNGAHEAEKLQQLLYGFIRKFVLCQNCGNPETYLSVKKRAETVKATCKACGATGVVDPQHRLTQFIIKNPPDDQEKSKEVPKPKNKGSDEDCGDSPEPIIVEDRADEDEDWGEDTTEEARKQRLEELSSYVQSLAVSSEVEKSKSERAQMFFTSVSKYNATNSLKENYSNICEEADHLDLGQRAVLVLAEVLLNNPETVVQQMKLHAFLFRKIIEFSGNAKKSQLNLLNGIVTLADKYPEMIRKAALLVKTMYDVDVCEEDVILEWADKGPSSKYGSKKAHDQVLKKCAALFEWLRQAEEESDDEESEEETQDIETKPAANGKEQQAIPQVSESTKPQSDDEIDIDAI